jgi:hypothetical protein
MLLLHIPQRKNSDLKKKKTKFGMRDCSSEKNLKFPVDSLLLVLSIYASLKF